MHTVTGLINGKAKVRSHTFPTAYPVLLVTRFLAPLTKKKTENLLKRVTHHVT